jgi:hypothetical protein
LIVPVAEAVPEQVKSSDSASSISSCWYLTVP